MIEGRGGKGKGNRGEEGRDGDKYNVRWYEKMWNRENLCEIDKE